MCFSAHCKSLDAQDSPTTHHAADPECRCQRPPATGPSLRLDARQSAGCAVDALRAYAGAYGDATLDALIEAVAATHTAMLVVIERSSRG